VNARPAGQKFAVGLALCVGSYLAMASPAVAQSDPPGDHAADPDEALLLSTGAIDADIAVISFDALGMDGERVARLETLFRKELDRLSKRPVPNWPTIQATIQGSKKLRACNHSNSCLSSIGKALGVAVVVSGNVAALGDSYILDIKAVSVKTGKELRRFSTDPLRGNPDELILSMRVAAYRLLAPEELLGSVIVLTDLVGATVKLDGKQVGKTPLPGPLYKLALGEHQLEVSAKDYIPYRQTVEVRFQKTTRVIVRMATSDEPIIDPSLPPVVRKRPAQRSWYTSNWMYLGVGVVAGVVGGYVGYRLARDPVIDCGATPSACTTP
jgi:hypothetical protein